MWVVGEGDVCGVVGVVEAMERGLNIVRAFVFFKGMERGFSRI